VDSVLFVLTGIVQTICIQTILYNGGGDRLTFLVAIPNYLGMTLVYFYSDGVFRMLRWIGGADSLDRHREEADESKPPLSIRVPGEETSGLAQRKAPFWMALRHPERRKLLVLGVNEIAGFATGLSGLAMAGSGLYQVIHSGTTVFTALLRTFFLRRKLRALQWVSIGIITAGLAMTTEQRPLQGENEIASTILTGIGLTLISCLFYSFNHVIAEYLLSEQKSTTSTAELPPPTGPDLSLLTGGSCFLFFSLYVLVHTIPQWDTLVTASIERHHGQRYLIAACYVTHLMVSYLHAVTHYDIVESIGAVPIGVLNGIRAVSVFGVSAKLFCQRQSSQCYSSEKGKATLVVISGALLFNYASSRVTHREKTQE